MQAISYFNTWTNTVYPLTERTSALYCSTFRRPSSLVRCFRLCVFVFVVLLSTSVAEAQNSSTEADSSRTTPLSTTPPSSGLTSPVEFSAVDSLIFRLKSGSRLSTLHGSAKVTYDGTILTAHEIDLLMAEEELHARGVRSDTGWVGRPQIIQGGDPFISDELSFNLKTQRGRMVAVQTQYEEGFIRAGVLKAMEDSTLFIKDGLYTTCSCTEDPSYSLRSNKMKMIGRKWIYTGPIQLFLYNIPTPLWLPFGFLPAQDTRRSGPLPPTYGEDQFGFYLRDWGWYFSLNEYMDLQLQGGFWTRGSWESKTMYRYRKMYAYDGQVMFDYARFRNGEPGDPDYSIRKTSAFRWMHNQTIGQKASFNANVNMSSSSYLQAVSQNYDDRIRQDLQSSVKFSQRWTGKNLTVQMNQRQVLSTGDVTMTLPSLAFSQTSFKPFARQTRLPGTKDGLRDKLTVGYNFNMNNQYQFRPLEDSELLARGDTLAAEINWFDALLSKDDFARATGSNRQFDIKASHRIPISAPFSIRRVPLLGDLNLNVSPSLSYSEDWYLETERRELNVDSTGTDITYEPGFFALRQFSSSVSMGTTFYGLFPVSGFGYQGIRHTVRPQIGFSYRPDFFGEGWGNTRDYTDKNGENIEYAVVSGVGRGRQQALTFSLSNIFETKRIQADSLSTSRGTGALQLLNLSVSTAYNFAADSLKMNDVRLSARTRILGKVDINLSSSFSPYQVNELGRLVDDSSVSWTSPLGRMTSTNITMRTSLRSKRGAGDRPLTTPRAGLVQTQPGFGASSLDGSSNILQNSYGLSTNTDFSIPWSTTLDFSYSITKTGISSIRRAILNASFDLSLTPNWKLASRTGYDIEAGKMATTSLVLSRDFECWQMSFNWVPFGLYQSWGFDLHVKSGHLRDLLRIRQPKSDVKNRFGAF